MLINKFLRSIVLMSVLLGLNQTQLFSQENSMNKGLSNDPVVDSVKMKFISRADYKKNMKDKDESLLWEYYKNDNGKVYKYFNAVEAVLAHLKGYHKRSRKNIVEGVVYVNSDEPCNVRKTNEDELPSKLYLRKSKKYFVK